MTNKQCKVILLPHKNIVTEITKYIDIFLTSNKFITKFNCKFGMSAYSLGSNIININTWNIINN